MIDSPLSKPPACHLCDLGRHNIDNAMGHIDENQLHELNRSVAPQAYSFYISTRCWRRRC